MSTLGRVDCAISSAFALKDTGTTPNFGRRIAVALLALVVVANIDVAHHLLAEIGLEPFSQIVEPVICDGKAKPSQTILVSQLLEFDMGWNGPILTDKTY